MAQKDVTSQYITNATLSNGTTGWTNVNFNNPVQGNNTTGFASECYAGWGSLEKTNYSLTQNITLPAGHYTLVNYSFFRQGLNADTDPSKSLAYLKAGENEVAVQTLGSISAGGYANSQAEGANAFDSKMYRNTLDFTIDANNTTIEIGLVGTFDLKQSWMIAGMFELIAKDIPATMDAPFDVTGYITNSGFEYRNMTGWTVSPSGYFGTQNNNQGFKVGGYYAEKWQQSGALPEGSMSQTLTDLPAGYYKLTANLGGNGTYIDLNGKTVSWTADGNYTTGYVLAENEDLTITAGKTAEGTANWIHFDNFKLHFCGDVAAALTTLVGQVSGYESKLPTTDYNLLKTAVNSYDQTYSDVDELLAAISAVQALYDKADLYISFRTALSDAQTVDQNAKMNGTVLSALQAAISDAGSINMESASSDITTAKNALITATGNATASIANYAEAKAILDAASTYDDAGQASYAADETIAAIQSAYDDGSLESVTEEQKNAAKEALATACKAQKQPADGCDMTAYIVNPGIDGNVDGWTCEMNSATGEGYMGGPLKPSNDAMEFWGASTLDANAAGKTFDYYQLISSLPVGAYTISAEMLNSTNGEEGANWNGGGKAGLYGKTTSAEVKELVTIDDETFRSYTTKVILVLDGELRIGVKNIAALTGRWFACDNFKLTYARQLNDAEKEEIAKENAIARYNEALAAAKAIEEGTIPASVYNNLQTTITNNTLADGTSTQYNDATDNLNYAAANALAMVKPYAAWKALKPQADALVAVSNNNPSANATLADAISTQNAAVEAAETTASVITTATSTLKTAMTTYATTAEPTNDECFDLTFMIENPHFTEGNGGTAIPTGWTLENGSITEHRLLTHNFEAYHKVFNLSQTIPNLQKGTYKVTLQGFARHDGADKDKTNLYCGIVNQPIMDIKDEYSTTSYYYNGVPTMGDTNYDSSYTLNEETVYQPNGMSGSYYWFQETNPLTVKPFYTNEVQTLITEAGNLKIGFKCETTSDWVIWDNFHLYYYGSAIAVALDEATGTSYAEDIDNANVTLHKTIYEGWNTITIPFEATAEDFGGGSLYKFVGDDETTLHFETASSIEPNVPYLLNATTPTEGVGTFTFNNVTVKAADGQTTEGTDYNFVGTYQLAIVADGDYILGAKDDVVAFYRSKGGNKVKAYRAFVQKKVDADPARLSIFIDGTVTSIDAIDGRVLNNAAIYNIAGQQVKNAQKGIYIHNGKKIVVK